MTKLLIIAGALAWGLWWCSDLYHGPQMKESVDYVVSEVKGFETKTTYSNAAQEQYRKTVATPMLGSDWLGRIRHQRGTAQWWALGLGPLALAIVYALRRTF